MKKSDKNADKKKQLIIPEGTTNTPKNSVTLKVDHVLQGTWIIGGYPENLSEFEKNHIEQHGVFPIHRTQSEPRKRKAALIDKIILLAFVRIKNRNLGVPDCVAQSVWDEIQNLYDDVEFEWSKPELVDCIKSMDFEKITYCPKPTKPQRTKEIRRSNFDSKLSRLRKRFQ